MLHVHGELTREHGGDSSVRDQGLLESALARPKNLYAYENVEDLARLAAGYAYGITRNHPFVDGNKRTAFTVSGVFLEMNSVRLEAPEAESYVMVLGLTTGEISETEFSNWISSRTKSVVHPQE